MDIWQLKEGCAGEELSVRPPITKDRLIGEKQMDIE